MLKSLLILSLLFTQLQGHKPTAPASSPKLHTGLYSLADLPNAYLRTTDNRKCFINPKPIVTPRQFEKISLDKDNQGYRLRIRLNAAGDAVFSKATHDNIGKYIAFIYDDKIVCMPRVMTQINGGIISVTSSNFSEQQWNELKKDIEKEMR